MGKIKKQGKSIKSWWASMKNLGLTFPAKKTVFVNTAIATASMGIVACIIWLMDLAVAYLIK